MRSPNYPKNPSGVAALAEGLTRASQETAIACADIVKRCAEISIYCPTDCDLLNVAHDIAAQRQQEREDEQLRTQEKRWLEECGPPQDFIKDAAEVLAHGKQIHNREAELWAKLRERFPAPTKGPNRWPNWDVLARAAHELGYDDFANEWWRSVRWERAPWQKVA